MEDFLPDSLAINELHILCHPHGLRQFMPNWSEFVEPFVRKINHEASMETGSAAGPLHDVMYCYPGIPEAADRSATQSRAEQSSRTDRPTLSDEFLSELSSMGPFIYHHQPTEGHRFKMKMERLRKLLKLD